MSFPISFDIIHLHTLLYTNLQPEKYCICNFTDKQPTNILTVMFYCQKDLLSCHCQWIPLCTFTQSPGITKEAQSILFRIVIKSWFLYHIARNFCSRKLWAIDRKNIGGVAVSIANLLG